MSSNYDLSLVTFAFPAKVTTPTSNYDRGSAGTLGYPRVKKKARSKKEF